MKKVFYSICISLFSILPLFSETIVINRESAIELLHQNNIDLESAAINLNIAERGRNTAWNILLPSINLSVSSSKDLSEIEQQFDFHLGAGVYFYIDFAIISNIREDFLSYQAGLLSYEQTVQKIEKNLLLQFNNILRLREIIKLQKESIDLAEIRYSEIRKRFEKNKVRETELLRTELYLEKLKPGLMDLETIYSNLNNDFKMILGLHENQDISIDGTLSSKGQVRDSDYVINKFMSNSLDLKIHNKSLQISENRSRITSLQNFTPALSMGYNQSILNYNRYNEEWNFETDEGLEAGYFNINLSMSLDSLIPGSHTYESRHNRKDYTEQQRLALKNTILKGRNDIINILENMENIQSQLKLLQENSDLSLRIFTEISDSYKSGNDLLLNVENAQNEYIKSRISIVDTQLTYLENSLYLERISNTPINELMKQ